jgi:hypothetical protein
VARTVSDESDEPFARPDRVGSKLVHQCANGPHHRDIRPLAISSDIVALTDTAALGDREQRAGVVLDIEPVAHILALAIDRQRLALERIEDDQRNELFGKMAGAEIVRAIGEQHRQAVGVMPGAHQMIGGRFRRRVRRIGPIGRIFAEVPMGVERPEHLIG